MEGHSWDLGKISRAKWLVGRIEVKTRAPVARCGVGKRLGVGHRRVRLECSRGVDEKVMSVGVCGLKKGKNKVAVRKGTAENVVQI